MKRRLERVGSAHAALACMRQARKGVAEWDSSRMDSGLAEGDCCERLHVDSD